VNERELDYGDWIFCPLCVEKGVYSCATANLMSNTRGLNKLVCSNVSMRSESLCRRTIPQANV
jgi:hypothetical protein